MQAFQTSWCHEDTRDVPAKCLQEAIAQGYDSTIYGNLHSPRTIYTTEQGGANVSIWSAEKLPSEGNGAEDKVPEGYVVMLARPVFDKPLPRANTRRMITDSLWDLAQQGVYGGMSLKCRGFALDEKGALCTRWYVGGMQRPNVGAEVKEDNRAQEAPATTAPSAEASQESTKAAAPPDFSCVVPDCDKPKHRKLNRRTHLNMHLRDQHGFKLAYEYGGTPVKHRLHQNKQMREQLEATGIPWKDTVFAEGAESTVES